MHRSLIIARIEPGSEPDIARIFGESDRTELPHLAGVVRRELYSLGDAYVHLLETRDDGPRSIADVREHQEFRRVSERLTPYVSAYLPTWRGPQDAMASRFYHWESTDGEASR